MKILSTGGRGFIGRRVVAELSARSDVEVIVTGRTGGEASKNFVFKSCDLLTPGEGARLIREVKPTHLLHLAWEATPGRFWRAYENLKWVTASLELLDAFRMSGGQRVVAAGTVAEYDWNQNWLDEAQSVCAPSTPYGVCKDAVRRVVECLFADGPTSWAWGRIFWLYGPGEAPGRLVSDVVAAVSAGRKVECTEGRQIRDFLHVDDVAGAFIAALDSNWSGVFNVSSGVGVPVRTVIELLAEASGRPDLFQIGSLPPRPQDPPCLVGDNFRLREHLDFHPKIDLRRGLSETLALSRTE